MTIPRTRRYPRQPMPELGFVKEPGEGGMWHIGALPPDDSMIAAALAERYGKRAAKAFSDNLRIKITPDATKFTADLTRIVARAYDFPLATVQSWTTNLTATSPPSAAPGALDWRAASEWVQTAGEAPEDVQLTGYMRHVTLSRDYTAEGSNRLEFDFTSTGDVHLPADWTPCYRKVHITITEAE